MKSILSISIFLLLFSIKGLSQESINSYKYVVVPTSYNFLNEPDQYQLNSLTKFLFEKQGFVALMADEVFPQDLNDNRCLALYADVEKHKAFLNTKLQVHLRDCNNKLVLSSEVGQSREKQYEKVYNLALRDAFKSFENLEYSYQPSSKVVAKTTSATPVVADTSQAQAEIDRLKMEVEALKERQLQIAEAEKQKLAEKEKAQTQEALDKAKAPEALEKAKEKESKIVQEAVKIEPAKTIEKETQSNESAQTLVANPVENGYTITDASSKLLYHLVFSGKEDVYIVKGQDAIVYKMNNAWIISTASDSGVTMKILKVKLD